jgi:hypothetical protein
MKIRYSEMIEKRQRRLTFLIAHYIQSNDESLLQQLCDELAVSWEDVVAESEFLDKAKKLYWSKS